MALPASSSRGPGPAWPAHQSTTTSRRRRHRPPVGEPVVPDAQRPPARAHEPVHPVDEAEVGVRPVGARARGARGRSARAADRARSRRAADTRRPRRASSGPGTGRGTRGSGRARTCARRQRHVEPGALALPGLGQLQAGVARRGRRPCGPACRSPGSPGCDARARSATRLRTWRLVRWRSDTISGCERLSIRKPWSSEKCRCSWFSLRSASSRIRARSQRGAEVPAAVVEHQPALGIARPVARRARRDRALPPQELDDAARAVEGAGGGARLDAQHGAHLQPVALPPQLPVARARAPARCPRAAPARRPAPGGAGRGPPPAAAPPPAARRPARRSAPSRAGRRPRAPARHSRRAGIVAGRAAAAGRPRRRQERHRDGGEG